MKQKDSSSSCADDDEIPLTQSNRTFGLRAMPAPWTNDLPSDFVPFVSFCSNFGIEQKETKGTKPGLSTKVV